MITLKLPRTVALAVVSALVTLGVVVSFMESYRALYWWAQGHAIHGVWAVLWPIQIDAFVAVGELSLFVALVDLWHIKHRSLPWLIVGAGLAASVAGNVGHVQTHDVFTRLAAAVPPLTAYVMLAASLGLLKRVVANQPKAKRASGARRRAPKPEPEAANVGNDFDALFRSEPMVGGGGGPAAPEMPEGWDPDATSAFPRIGADGHPAAAEDHAA